MKVSVIIPTYNRALLVQETLDSVLRQSFRDFEIIVVDDGSTDNTEQALKRYSSHIRYIKQENRGINAARNRAIGLSHGEYIALLDNDDLWPEWKLALDVAILDAYPHVGFVYGDFHILKPGGVTVPNGLHTWFPVKPEWKGIFRQSIQWDVRNLAGQDGLCCKFVDVYLGDIYHTSLFGPRVLPSASLFRKSLAKNWLQLNEGDSSCGDWEFFSRLSHRHGAAFIDHETAYNRSHEDAVRLTRLDHRIQIRKRVDMINRVWKLDEAFYREHHSEVDSELTMLLGQLTKLHLMAGDANAARSVLDELDQLGTSRNSLVVYLYKVLVFLPRAYRLLPLLRAMKRTWISSRLRQGT